MGAFANWSVLVGEQRGYPLNTAEWRKNLESQGLDESSLLENPIQLFDQWFTAAKQAGIYEHNAMSLATCTSSGAPSVRTVLLKLYDDEGFVFFTNYGSRKSQEIDQNPQVALLFPWVEISRQIRIEGTIRKVSTAESLKYFSSRPRESQLGAWVSQQSELLSSRGLLEQKLLEIRQKFGEGKVPLPSFWGGYRVIPEAIEFWQGRPHRLHDRFVYRKSGESWAVSRLQP